MQLEKNSDQNDSMKQFQNDYTKLRQFVSEVNHELK